MAFTLTNWNTLIQAANVKRQIAIDANCVAPEDPLEEVTDPHLWSKLDITNMQDFLKILCDDGSFSEVPDYWSQTIFNEIADHIADVEACDCEEYACYDTSYQPISIPLLQTRWYINLRRLNNGICSPNPSATHFQRWWINAYDELYQYQLYPAEDISLPRTWALKLEFDAWTPSDYCTTLPAKSLTIAAGNILQDGTIFAFPSGWLSHNEATIGVNHCFEYEGPDHCFRKYHFIQRPYTYTLYGYKNEDC